jgi:integrase
MGRPPLPVGTFGQIHFLRLDKHRVAARTYFRDLDGRRRLVTRYGQTRAQAERRLREALRDRSTGATPPVPADSRLSAMAALWLADVDGSDRASGTKRLYRFVTNSYVLPALGELRLREVTVPALDRLLTSVHSAHGPAAAKTTRSVLSGILGLAVRHGLLATNPVRETPARRGPRDSRRRPRALTLEETHQLRAWLADDPTAVRQDLPDLVAFMLGTGLRIGEACAVRPTDLDVDAGTLTVAGTVARDPLLGLFIQERPKTDAGRRTIALPPQTLDLLRRRLARLPAAADPPVLFPSPKGLLRDPNNTSGDLRQALDRAGFPWATSHTFRRTVATRLDDAGLSARQIADHLGHSRPSLTQDVYLGRGTASPLTAAALPRSL